MVENTERRAGVVDDNTVNELVGGGLLKALGFEFVRGIYADDPAERAKKAIAADLDLMLLDSQMPGENGETWIGRLRGALQKRVLVILATAEGNPDECLRRAIENVKGDPWIEICKRVIKKPFQKEDVALALGLSTSQTNERRTERPQSAQELQERITGLLSTPSTNRDDVKSLLRDIHALWDQFVEHPEEANRKERIFCHVIKNAAINLDSRLEEISGEEITSSLLELQSLLKSGDSTQNMSVRSSDPKTAHENIKSLFNGEKRLTMSEPPEGIWVNKYGWEVAIAIANLVSNALKAGLKASEVSIDYRIEGNELVIRVLDDGNPFPEDFQKKMLSGATGNGFQDIEHLGFTIDLSEAYGLKGAWNTLRRWFLGERKKAISLRVPLREAPTFDEDAIYDEAAERASVTQRTS